MLKLKEFPVENKTVIVRVDYNVPMSKGKVRDNNKIRLSLPTIKFLLKKNCKIILMTHLGRPQGKVVKSLKVDPILKELKKLLPKSKIRKLNDSLGEKVRTKIKKGKNKEIFLLENLRFHKGEETDDSFFAQSLASLAEIYINDAFAVSHRKHASVHKITKYLPSLPGLQLEKEIYYLSKARTSKHAIWIMGGAKLHKIDLLKLALKKADSILIGGALPFAFMKAKGINIGMSKTDVYSVRAAKKLLTSRVAKKKLILPIDFKVSETFSANSKPKTVDFNKIETKQIALDLGPETIKLFRFHLQKAKTIVWNGPLGYFEWSNYAIATREIGRFISRLDATTICGGGETAEAVHKFHLQSKLTHVSTGGGASLAFLAGKKLPGLEALKKIKTLSQFFYQNQPSLNPETNLFLSLR